MSLRGQLALAAALAPSAASAFFGFFVSGADAKLTSTAGQVVLTRKGNRTVLSMSNNYRGPPEDFALVVPVPVVLQEEDVETLEPTVFDHIDQLSAPRLVEYWEQDPCGRFSKGDNLDDLLNGASSGAHHASPPAPRSLGVSVEAKFAVGEYRILILSAREAGGLEEWLRLHHYRIPRHAARALAPYIRSQQKFFVAKVDINKVKRDLHGVVVLSPLRFSYESPELRLPVRLGLLNAAGKQDLIVYVLHPSSRFEVANYPNVFIPTNLDVVNRARQSFGAFYAALFDRTLRRSEGGRAIVTEYTWQTSSCDPCPVPPLQPADLRVLGDDVLANPEPPASGPSWPTGRTGFNRNFPSWVLTRLHARYDRATLSEDLVFREASPVVGGRSRFDGSALELEPAGEAQPDQFNNFQGRYIIRHRWRGPVACDHQRWNVWGGPPGGGPSLTSATDSANVPRGKIALRKVVRSALPRFGLPGLGVRARPDR